MGKLMQALGLQRRPEELDMELLRAESAIPFQSSRFVGIGNDIKQEKLLQYAVGDVAIAVRPIAERIADLELQVVARFRTREGAMEEEVLDDHPLAMIFKRPNDNWTLSQMLRLAGEYISIVGEAYWLKVTDNALGAQIPSSVWVMPAQNVGPVLTDGVITGYNVYAAEGEIVRTLDASEVVRMWRPDPENIYMSKGVLEDQSVLADLSRFQQEHLRSFYGNDALPPVMLVGDGTATTPKAEARKAFYKYWRQNFLTRGGKNAGLPGWIPAGWKPEVVDTSQRAQADAAVSEGSLNTLLKAFGVPRSILGEVVSGDRSSAETNQYVFDQHTISPITKIIEEALTQQLAADYPQRPGVELVVRFKPFIAPDKDFELRQEQQDLALKVRTAQQVINDRGGDGEEAAPWGEYPVGSIADVPYTGEEVDLTGFSADDPDAVDAPAGANVSPPTSATPDPANVATETETFDESQAITPSQVLNGAQVTSLTSLVTQVEAGGLSASAAKQIIMVGFGIKESVADAMVANAGTNEPTQEQPAAGTEQEAVPEAERELRTSHPPSEPSGSIAAHGGRRALPRGLTLEGAWERATRSELRYAKRFRRAQASIFEAQRKDTIKNLEAAYEEPERSGGKRDRVTMSEIFRWKLFVPLFHRRVDPIRERNYFDVANATTKDLQEVAPSVTKFDSGPAVRKFLTDASRLNITSTSRTTAKKIVRELARGQDAGESLPQLTARINRVFRLRQKQAATIARTEIAKSSSAATQESYTQSDVVESRQWNTALDPKVRDTHQIENQTVAMNEPFVLNDGELAESPLNGWKGRKLSAGNAVNCRCFITPVIAGFEDD